MSTPTSITVVATRTLNVPFLNLQSSVSYIYIFVTYSLFTKGIDKFKELYEKGMFDGIYTTNLSYIDEEYLKEQWLHRVDCSEFVSQIIYNLHNEMSISDLQNNRSYPSKVLAEKFKQTKQLTK